MSNGQASGYTLTMEQARLVGDHVTFIKNSSTVASTGASVSQDAILAELQKISQRFTIFEEQMSQDRSVISDLVYHLQIDHQIPVTQHIMSTGTLADTS